MKIFVNNEKNEIISKSNKVRLIIFKFYLQFKYSIISLELNHY